ncbi:MAG: hypothetical protein IJK42_10410 [Prevotella sp.]|nr:hypothetical protein [Prevotella sp.]MBQ6210165.1 hypothetical protein [Prevotella sp.]
MTEYEPSIVSEPFELYSHTKSENTGTDNFQKLVNKGIDDIKEGRTMTNDEVFANIERLIYEHH